MTHRPGYLHDHALTRETLAEDGWLRTGDLATLGPNGAYTAILEAGVGGVPSPLGEHDVMAFVVFRDGLHPAEAEIAAFCAARLAAFKVPTRWRVLEALPRTATQRVAYHLLPR